MVQQVLYRALVSTKWLAESVRAGKLGLRGAGCVLVLAGHREARNTWSAMCPGASFFDIEQCRDKAWPYEMMLPSGEGAADYVGGWASAAARMWWCTMVTTWAASMRRGSWWMFRVFGHRTVSVLNGGFRNWLKEGHPVTSEPSRPEPAIFKATLNRSLLKTYEQVLESLESKVSAGGFTGPKGRYLGTQSEPDAVGRCPVEGWSLGSNAHGEMGVGCLGPSLGFCPQQPRGGPQSFHL